jgi:protein-disulfide isomerase
MSWSGIYPRPGEPVRSPLRLLATLLLLGPPSLHAQDAAANRTLGSASAPVTVYEMSDFQCPYCRNFATQTFSAINNEYIKTGKVRWVFVNFPLTDLHPNAVAAAEFAMCAARQKKFWPAHDRLYAMQDRWAELGDPAPFFLAQIKPLGLDQQTTLDCLTSRATLPAIRDDALGAAKSGAKSTPSFYIEGGMMVGAQPLAVFRHVLDSIVTAKGHR